MLLLLLPVSLMNMTLTVTLNAKVLYKKSTMTFLVFAGSEWRCDGWYKSEQVNERWMAQTMDQGASTGAMDSRNDGAGSKWTSAGWHKRWIREQVMMSSLSIWAKCTMSRYELYFDWLHISITIIHRLPLLQWISLVQTRSAINFIHHMHHSSLHLFLHDPSLARQFIDPSLVPSIAPSLAPYSIVRTIHRTFTCSLIHRLCHPALVHLLPAPSLVPSSARSLAPCSIARTIHLNL